MPFFKKCDQNVDIRGSDTHFDKLSNRNSLVIEKALAESTTAFFTALIPTPSIWPPAKTWYSGPSGRRTGGYES
jgi:hypothetical protein